MNDKDKATDRKPYVPYVQDKTGERVSEQVRVLVTPTMYKLILKAAQAIYTSNSSILRMCVEYALGDPSPETISIVEALHGALQEKEQVSETEKE